MTGYIDSLKSKLTLAVDLKQKRILNLNSVLEALKQLQTFPMTLDMLNSSRIGKIVNDIRHFDDIKSDIKKSLKDLIKHWNGLLPSSSNVSGNSNILHSNGVKIDSKPKSIADIKSASTNNLKTSNGVKESNKRSYDTINDNSMNETIPKKPKLVDKNYVYKESPIMSESDSCPPPFNGNVLDDGKLVNFPDVKALYNADKISSPAIKENKKKRRDTSQNGVVAPPLPKVKSTKELLAGFGEIVEYKTKKRIMCNEIAPEADIQKSWAPEPIRAKSKLTKISVKSQLSSEYCARSVKNSPKPNPEPDYIQKSMMERAAENARNAEKCAKLSPLNSVSESPRSDKSRKRKLDALVAADSLVEPASEPGWKSYSTLETESREDNPMKMKLKTHKPKSHKKKKKHKHSNIDPPITNRMNDIPIVEYINENFDQLPSIDQSSIEIQQVSEDPGILADKLAYTFWDHHNCTYHPQNNQPIDYKFPYNVDSFLILPWIDTITQPKFFFPDDTDTNITNLLDSIKLES